MLEQIGITGGSGYISFSLAKHLSKKFEVTIFDVKSPKDPNSKLAFRQCDIRSYENVNKALQGMDLVIHTAIVQIPQINEQKKLGYEVNISGTDNVCRAVEENPRTKGMILASSWHTIGERQLTGIIDEEFGFRPDKVEDRARLYALSKMAQESIVRLYAEMSEKVFGVIRMGTVLGEGMPEKTAANIFIENGLNGKPLTPYRHSMFRPMLYVDIIDVCRAYENFARKILNGEVKGMCNSLTHVFNMYYPEAVTILDLAEIVRDAIIKYSNGQIRPKIEVVETGQPSLFTEEDKTNISVDMSKALRFLDLENLRGPKESIEELIKARVKKSEND